MAKLLTDTKIPLPNCPHCGVAVEEFKGDSEIVRSNPESVHVTDDGLVISNPNPPPWLTENVVVSTTWTYEPCGHGDLTSPGEYPEFLVPYLRAKAWQEAHDEAGRLTRVLRSQIEFMALDEDYAAMLARLQAAVEAHQSTGR